MTASCSWIRSLAETVMSVDPTASNAAAQHGQDVHERRAETGAPTQPEDHHGVSRGVLDSGQGGLKGRAAIGAAVKVGAAAKKRLP